MWNPDTYCYDFFSQNLRRKFYNMKHNSEANTKGCDKSEMCPPSPPEAPVRGEGGCFGGSSTKVLIVVVLGLRTGRNR